MNARRNAIIFKLIWFRFFAEAGDSGFQRQNCMGSYRISVCVKMALYKKPAAGFVGQISLTRVRTRTPKDFAMRRKAISETCSSPRSTLPM